MKREWLTQNEIVDLVDEHSEELGCNEDLLLEFHVNEDDKKAILDLLKGKEEIEEYQAIKLWQRSALLTIEQSQKPVAEKLRDIELQWSRFDYPEAWRNFIYYIPSEKSSSSEGVYQIFLAYLDKESKYDENT